MNGKMNRRNFDNILNECLERVLKGEPIDACLAAYPEYASELKPLLETALGTKAAAAIGPRPGFRQRAALEFQKAIQEMPARETPAKAPRPGFRWRAAWMTPFAVFIVILFAALGTAAAARNALPDNPLYNVKLATESVQLALTFSDIDKAELYAELNDKRVAEIVEMAEQGKAVQVVKTTDLLASNMIAMADLTSGDGKSAGDGIFNFMMSSEEAATPPQATQPLPERGHDVATTTAPTTTTTTTAEPSLASPNAAEPQTTQPAPAPVPTTTVVTVPPMPAPTTTVITMPPAAVEESFGLGGGRDRVETEEDLKAFLTEKQLEALRILYEQLERAPDWLKPQIQAAIDVILEGYNTSINNLRG